MSKETLMRDNKDFEYILNDFFGSKHKRDTIAQNDWNNSNVIIIEKDQEMYLRQSRYYPYDLNKSRMLDEDDYEYIINKQNNILYIFEDGSYSIINKE
ncbi:hypothetical protein [Paenibacillus tianjinensis]|uniref:Uncharacterized protein n=1 Tax=Paenibacillus tianjinensis TaxID=2810347 RepID=A0ABX7L7Z8_9BACL|nr:hypothetical protein [Paenibacillus tianjinensis]QSF43466.1 hypothetical protein JRJ22_19575 [Paenibacillus tianjinensis]